MAGPTRDSPEGDVGSRARKDDRTRKFSHDELESVVEQRTRELAAALEALQQRERLFRGLTENATDFTLVINKDGLITYASPSVERYSGYSQEEVIGHNYEKFSLPEDVQIAHKAFDSALKSPGQTIHVPRSRLHIKDGRVFYYEALITNMRLVDGVDGIVINMRNISERVIAERSLAESERELKNLTNLLPVCVFRGDLAGKLTYVNDRWREVMGLEGDAALGDGWDKAIHPEDLDKVSRAWRQVVDNHGVADKYETECRVIRPDGSQKSVIMQVACEYAEDGQLLGYVGSVTDVTAQKSAEAALLVSEERFSLAMTGANDGLWDWDLVTDRVYRSPRWLEMLGYKSNELPDKGGTWKELLHPDDRSEIVTLQTKWLKDEVKSSDVEVRFRHKDGHYIDVLLRATLIRDDNGTPIRMVGTNTDISRRKRAEQALADSEERFSLAMLGSSDGLYDWDLETGNFYYSPRWYEMLGYSGDELEGTTEPWEQLIHPDDLPRITKFQNDWMKSDAKSTEIEVRLRHKDGHYVDILSRSILVRDSDGTPTRMVGTNTDISARKRAEKALLESEEKFRAMTENTTDFIVIFDSDGLHKYVSPSVIRATGVDAEDLIGQPVYDFIHSEDKQKFSQTLKQAQKHPGETFYLPELRLVFQDRLVYLETLFTALPNVPGVDGVVSNARDISAKKKAEYDLVIAKEQAETANKAKSQFLSSMSHELRTPMNAILGYTQLLEQNAAGPLNKDQKTFVEEIMRSGHHMLELIGDVLDLTKIESGNISLEIEDQEPWPLIDTCLKMVSGLAAQRGISIENQIPFDDLPIVSVDGLRFKQAFLNVLSNAVKYNRPDGEVTLKCAKTDSGNFCVSVSDTGPGITQEMHDKVFEPFDRLGAESSDIAGTGIGLSVSKQLVEGMGGRIGFESALGEGSTFWIEVPLAG